MEDFCRLVSRLDERHVAEYTLKKEFQEQREEIQAQFENFETLSTQALLAPPRRTTRRQAENAELPKMSIKESLVHEVKSITDKLWMGQLADIDDGDVLQSRIDSIANGSLASLKEIMIQIINSVPNSNLNDHLWNGKEKFVYLEVIRNFMLIVLLIFWSYIIVLRNLMVNRTSQDFVFFGQYLIGRSSGKNSKREKLKCCLVGHQQDVEQL